MQRFKIRFPWNKIVKEKTWGLIKALYSLYVQSEEREGGILSVNV